MTRIALFLACSIAVVASAVGVATALGAASMRAVVGDDGRTGDLRIDVSTEAQVRMTYGNPDRVEDEFFQPGKILVGHTLYYGCGHGCETGYSISKATGRLSDFETSSPGFVTERGSRVGMPASEAARRERKKLGPGCDTDNRLIYLRWDMHHEFVLTASGGKVRQLVYLGSHSVVYDGVC
jgi:hypothetical protein